METQEATDDETLVQGHASLVTLIKDQYGTLARAPKRVCCVVP
jgi:hypothetical protein